MILRLYGILIPPKDWLYDGLTWAAFSQFAAFGEAVARLRGAGISIEDPLDLLTVEEIAEMKNGADFDAIAITFQQTFSELPSFTRAPGN